ncbi:MAG: prolyl oligopeptidase family serine peptidase, partial [Pseudomonadota bacterium]
AGFRQWGERMQLDVMDGLSHLVDEGIADPERACIVGGSYGGYAALVAAYKAVDRLRCAVSFAGVADLAELKDKWYFYAFGRRAVARIQNGPDMLANSPIENVEKIGLPLLLVHGDVDTTVVIEQATRFVEALDKAGKDYRYIEQRNGDHYFSLQSHRVEYLRAVGEFLAQHIGPEASVGSAR